MDSRSAASAEQATPVTWQVFASKHWGSNWVLGRKTEKSIKRHAQWDSASQTYKPPRFVTKDEYNALRERWWSYRVDLLENALEKTKINGADNYQYAIDQLKVEVTELEDSLASARKDNARLEEALDEKQRDIDPMVAHVKSLLYRGNVMESLIYLERGYL